MIKAGRRLARRGKPRFQAGLDAFRSRKEVLKASYTAAHASLVIHKALATVGLAGNGDLRQEDHDEATGTADARLCGMPPPRWNGNRASRPGHRTSWNCGP